MLDTIRIFILKTLFLMANILAVISVYAENIPSRLDEFLVNNFPYNHFGVVVLSLDDNKILYQNNQNKLFVPASLIKLFTLASSLEGLTPKFKFETKLSWDNNKIYNNNLKSDVNIIFSGDPTLKQKHIEDFMITLKRHKIDNIEGNIIVDDTIFSDCYANGWLVDDLPWGYAAPASAIVISENKIPLIANSMNTLGQNVIFSIPKEKRELYPFKVDSRVIAATQQQNLLECRLNILINSNNDIFCSGCTKIEATDQKINLALNAPDKYLQWLLKKYLNKHKISLLGNILFQKVTKNLPNNKIYYSDFLSEILKNMMVNSNNIYAHSIGKSLGAKLYGHGSFQTAAKAITDLLHKKFTVNTGTLNIVDSSGLSVYNVATPNHFIRLLQAIYKNKKLYQQTTKILAKPGYGTLSNRLTAGDLSANIIAKTGTLKHSLGLAGYIKSQKGLNLAFAFIVNDLLENDFKIKQLIDEMCEILINYY